MESALLAALHADPGDGTAWLALADWLEESGQPERAELLRLRVALCANVQAGQRRQPERRLQELLASGVRPCGPVRALALPGGVEMVLALVPPGSFQMGSPRREEGRMGNEEPRHRVTLTRGFHLGIYPVTQAQWQAVMGHNPAHFRGDHRPIDNVSWQDCQGFCKALSQIVGLPCRLPREVEWEYACRAGTTTTWYTGNTVKSLRRACWCSYDGWGRIGETAPVGQREPNAFGLFDMHGTIWEWCQDHAGTYPRRHVTDPPSRRARGDYALRGGGWCSEPTHCRSAYRHQLESSRTGMYFGCRVAVPLGE
jgi:uncharacterized protein (TIGR02996 family)